MTPSKPQYDSIVQSDWFVRHGIWAPVDNDYNQVHGGVISDNVVRDANGDVVIFVNGDYYEGTKRGIDFDGLGYPDVYGGKRTGGVIQSKNTYGPGRFEALLKIPSVNGVCSSIWLFNYVGESNYEIDIELHGTAVDANGQRINNTDLSSILCSSWLTEEIYTSINAAVNKPLADGQFHKFRFDWHTGDDPRVEYYVDDICVLTIRENVPTNEMYVNIGCWFPYNWCGQPTFETDAMVIRSFTYTPFADESATNDSCDTLSGAEIRNGEISECNLLANGNFDSSRQNFVWTVDGTFVNGSLDGTVSQVVQMDAELVEYCLKLSGTGNITVTVSYGSIVDGVDVSKADNFDLSLDGNAQIAFTPPTDCTTFTIEIASENATLNSAALSIN